MDRHEFFKCTAGAVAASLGVPSVLSAAEETNRALQRPNVQCP